MIVVFYNIEDMLPEEDLKSLYSAENEENHEGGGMRKYLDTHGWHFSKKLYDHAVSKMRGKGGVAITPMSKEQVDAMLLANDIELEHDAGYDYCYVANMAKADYFGSSIIGEANLARFVKDYIDDPDGYKGKALRHFIADAAAKGHKIEWEEYL